ncbi:MAG TPA: hypothetical protein VGI92_11990 [Gemmatimonadales bacterium]|jgi:hypothetical protein
MRKILGFAVLAVVAWLVLKIVFGLLGTIIGLGITVLILAVVGYCFYLVLRLVAPGLADKVSGMISGRAPSDLDRV